MMLICLLLSDVACWVSWQGIGSEINSPIFNYIWAGLQNNLNTVLTANNQNGTMLLPNKSQTG